MERKISMFRIARLGSFAGPRGSWLRGNDDDDDDDDDDNDDDGDGEVMIIVDRSAKKVGRKGG